MIEVCWGQRERARIYNVGRDGGITKQAELGTFRCSGYPWMATYSHGFLERRNLIQFFLFKGFAFGPQLDGDPRKH